MKPPRAPHAVYRYDPISISGRGVRFQSSMSAFALTRTCGAAWFVPMLALVGAPQMLLGERFIVAFSGGKLRPTTAPADRASPCEDAAASTEIALVREGVLPVRPAAEPNRWAQELILGPLPESSKKYTFRTLPAFSKIHEITTHTPRRLSR
jgi:hypothetical protein